MKKIFFSGIFLLTLLCCVDFVFAQTSFVFMPEVQGRTVDGLLQVRLTNSSGPRVAVLTITVNEATGGNIATIKSAPFQLLPGTNPLPSGAMSKAALRFGTSKVAAVCRQSGYFTEGDYEYCFELTAGDSQHNGEVIAEQCFNYYLQPFSPLLLVNPAEQDVICNKRPSFFWQPLLPNIPGVQYRLLLTAVKPGQSKTEAINYNMPLINQFHIATSVLFYPSSSQELTKGATYAWQVAAYRNDVLLASSEIWEFTVKCEEVETKKTPESFRDIADLAAGNFYVAQGKLLFATHNIYGPARLDYTITGITKPEQSVKHLPVVKLNQGTNHVVIDLSDSQSFEDGNYYLLDLKLPSGERKQLRFLYKQPTE